MQTTQVHPQLCIADLVAVQQRGGNCANIALHVLRSITEKHPAYYSPEVWVSGVVKAVILQSPGQGVRVEARVPLPPCRRRYRVNNTPTSRPLRPPFPQP